MRNWVSPAAQAREADILERLSPTLEGIDEQLDELIDRNRAIHELDCINLNPATNVMNPRAEQAMARGLGCRPSLGHPGEKYEMGLEAVEEIEVITAELATRVFGARFAEVRVASGAMANLYTFMAFTRPGDAVIVPPASIGGHVTHNQAGAAGLYGLEIHEAPVNGDNYTIDVTALAELAERVRPKLITVGQSLNLHPHPVVEVHNVARTVGARLLFDAAHACGMFAGRIWPNPLDLGADVMTMSTYKSLGGPPSGLVLTNREDVAATIDAIAYPGLTANFDAGKTAALAITLLDWLHCGSDYASTMVDTAAALADALTARSIPLFSPAGGPTNSHQFAIDATDWGGGHAAALRLRGANLLACAIGLPNETTEGAGLRVGTPEMVRWGMTVDDMDRVGDLIARGLTTDPESVAADTTAFRSRFRDIHFTR